MRCVCCDQYYRVGIVLKMLFLWAIVAENIGFTKGEDLDFYLVFMRSYRFLDAAYHSR